jgi:excinuclease UvrABC helicase subunit UvrB
MSSIFSLYLIDAFTSKIHQISKRSTLQHGTCFFSIQKISTLEDLTYYRELQCITNSAPTLIIALLHILLVAVSLRLHTFIFSSFKALAEILSSHLRYLLIKNEKKYFVIYHFNFRCGITLCTYQF